MPKRHQSLSRRGGRRRVWGMRYFLLLIMAVALVGCGKKEAIPANIADPIVGEGIRISLKKPTGELTKADLEKVTVLRLKFSPITDAGLLVPSIPVHPAKVRFLTAPLDPNFIHVIQPLFLQGLLHFVVVFFAINYYPLQAVFHFLFT